MNTPKDKLPSGTRISHGITLRRDGIPARRVWWIVDIGRHSGAVREALILAAGARPDEHPEWAPRVSFPSLNAAVAACAAATKDAP